MLFKALVFSALLALGSLSSNVHAAEITWTVTMNGRINNGYDTTGVFGSVGRDLTGLSYTQSITISTDVQQWGSNYSSDYMNAVAGGGPGFTDTVTVDGYSVTFVVTTDVSGQQMIINDLSQGSPHASPDHIVSAGYGNTPTGDRLETYNSAFSFATAFIPTLNFDQSISQNTSNEEFCAVDYICTISSFSISGAQTAQFHASADFIRVNTVPEPETYAMLLAGLGLIGFMARPRPKAALPARYPNNQGGRPPSLPCSASSD